MSNEYDIEFIQALNKTFLNEEQIKELEGYSKKYANKSDQFLLREIQRIKPTVPQNVINQHINNLDHLYHMDGFINRAQKQRIDMIKKILSSPSGRGKPDAEGQFFCCGSGLLLWFLVLAAIWRRPYYY